MALRPIPGIELVQYSIHGIVVGVCYCDLLFHTVPNVPLNFIYLLKVDFEMLTNLCSIFVIQRPLAVEFELYAIFDVRKSIKRMLLFLISSFKISNSIL
jgi:hypothetical protein